MKKVYFYKWNTGFLTQSYREMIGEEGIQEMQLKAGSQTLVPVMSFGVERGGRVLVIDSGLDGGKKPMGSQSSKYQPEYRDILPHALEGETCDIYFTHLDSDHCGNLNKLNYRTAVVHSFEKEYAKKNKSATPRLFEDVLFEELLPEDFSMGLLPFPKIDRFEDGTFYIVHTPGHTPGHLCYLYHVDDYGLLFCGDLFENYEALKYPPVKGQFNSEAYEKNIKILLNWIQDDERLVLLPAHDTAIEKILPDGPIYEEDFQNLISFQRTRLKSLGIL